MRLKENLHTPSLVVNNNQEIWNVLDDKCRGWVSCEETNDEMVVEFIGKNANVDRNQAIDDLNTVDAWPQGYTPEKK